MDDFDSDFGPDVIEPQIPWLDTPLDIRRHCIRILILDKGPNDSTITCNLQTVSLDDYPDYETLSYVWGDPAKTKPITVSGVTYNATENLVDFLCCLRQQTMNRSLWVDAICIDQSNVAEKNHQLGLMARIYRQAQEAHIWFGHFTQSWSKEIICDSKQYTPTSEMTPEMWAQTEKICHYELRHFLKAGGKAIQQFDSPGTDEKLCDSILPQTLDVLDKAAEPAGGEHLHKFPLFVVVGEVRGSDRYEMNKHWLTILDCIRWLLSRQWWTRVWTLQEAVLPRVDPIIHAHPHLFRISRLLNGVQSIFDHRLKCCKDIGRVFLGEYQRFPIEPFSRAYTLHGHRKDFKSTEQEWLPLENAIESVQGRKATDLRDHFFGILGMLPHEWQSGWFSNQGYNCSTAGIFSQCTKLLYTNYSSLTRLAEAIGLRQSDVRGLPSWAIDLSAQLPQSDNDYLRWKLYGASSHSDFKGVKLMCDLAEPDLTVRAISIGVVHLCATRVPQDLRESGLGSPALLRRVCEWQRLCKDCKYPPDDSKFWRAAFMDRNIWLYWLHERKKPLASERLVDIKKWWRSWNETGDERDLTRDKQANDGSHGDYHFRALKLNAESARFFCTAKSEPGMGPHDMRPSDVIYVLAGCKAPAILRPITRNGKDAFLFVGLCFVDGWMYGKATRGSPDWQTLELY